MARKQMTAEEAREYAAAKRAKVAGLIETALDKLTDPATWAAYLAQANLLARYSPRNQMLIFMQDPEATDCDGFVHWRERGRQVRKGETGLMIFAPVTYSKKDREGDGRQPGEMTSDDLKGIKGIKVATVFDIAQTDPIDGAEFREAERAQRRDLEEYRAVITDIAGDNAAPILAAMDKAEGVLA